MNPITIVLAAISAAGAIGLALTLMQEKQIPVSDTSVLGDRLQPFVRAQLDLAEEDELSQPFWERVIRPVLERLGKRLSKPDHAKPSNSSRLLRAAGYPYGLTLGAFNALVLLCVSVLATIAYFVMVLLGGSGTQLLVGPAIGTVLGVLGPRFWLARKGNRRLEEIQVSLPSVCDLLTISVEAGLALDSALSRVCERYQNALASEFAIALRSIQLGVPRADAFTALAERCCVDDVSTFVRSINQSQEMGTGLGRVLRIYSEELRRRRRERAEQKGQQAPLKMLFPMVGCIFPTLFIILLGPAILQITGK